MSIARSRYFQESWENSLAKSGMPPKLVARFIAKASRLVDPQHSTFPREFFDLERSARILSRQERCTEKQAQEKILKSPGILFDLFDIPTLKKAPPPKEKNDEAPEQLLRISSVIDNLLARRGPYLRDELKEKLIKASKELYDLYDAPLENDGANANSFSWYGEQRDAAITEKKMESLLAFVRQKSAGNTLKLSDIKDSILETHKQSGRRPTKNDGAVQYGLLAGEEQWNALDMAFKRGNRGLKNCGFGSLKELMDQMKLPENIQAHRHRDRAPPAIPLEHIKDSIQQTFLGTGKTPTADGTLIAYGELKDKMKWSALNSYLSRRGEKEYGLASLKAVISTFEWKQVEEEAPPELSVQDVFHECAVYAKSMQWRSVPSIGPISPKISQLDHALRNGNVTGMEPFLRRQYTNIIDFMLATGLFEKRGQDIVAAPLPKIDLLAKTFV